jgi:hypothetical protein
MEKMRGNENLEPRSDSIGTDGMLQRGIFLRIHQAAARGRPDEVRTLGSHLGRYRAKTLTRQDENEVHRA